MLIYFSCFVYCCFKSSFYIELVWLDCFPPGVQIERLDPEDAHGSSHCCLVAIGRLQVTSTPNNSDIMGSNSSNEFISRHNMEGKFTFVDQRWENTYNIFIIIIDNYIIIFCKKPVLPSIIINSRNITGSLFLKGV